MVDRNVGSSPVESVVEGSNRYNREAGLPLVRRGFSNIIVPLARSNEVGRAYMDLPEFDKSAVPAYRQMREETGRQYDFMTRSRRKGGLGLDVEITKHDPYGADNVNNVIREVRDDVLNNNRIRALATSSTGGHPYFTDDENDMFRAVHDVFGHLGSGRGIDMHGEEAAYQKHAGMFSPLARQAMATETRGQNGALHLRGEFQDQKVAALPQHLQALQFVQPRSAQENAESIADARLENRKQGIG